LPVAQLLFVVQEVPQIAPAHLKPPQVIFAAPWLHAPLPLHVVAAVKVLRPGPSAQDSGVQTVPDG